MAYPPYVNCQKNHSSHRSKAKQHSSSKPSPTKTLALFGLLNCLTLVPVSGVDFTVSHELDCEGNISIETACATDVPAFRAKGVLPNSSTGSAGSLWWAWTPPRPGWATFCARSTSGPLEIRIQNESGSLATTELPSDDPSTTTHAVTADPSTPLWIELTSDVTPTIEFDFTVVLRPLNDDFERRTSLAVDSEQTHIGHNYFATEEHSEPNHHVGSASRDPAHNTVWWSFTAPDEVTTMAIETISYQFDSERAPSLAVYRGDEFPTEADQVASNFSGARNPFAFQVESGQTYHLAIDSLKPFDDLDSLNAYGEFSFVVREATTIENDNFHTPNELILGGEPVLANVQEATENPDGDPRIGPSAGGSSLWWYWDAPNYELEVVENDQPGTSVGQAPLKVLIEKQPGQVLFLRIVDQLGTAWESASNSPTLLPHQEAGFEALRPLLPSGSGIFSEPLAQVSQIKSLTADILGFRPCLSLQAMGTNINDQAMEMMIGVFTDPTTASSQPFAARSDQLTFCVSLDSQRFLIGLDNKLWENPKSVQIELDWAEPRPTNDDFERATPLELNTVVTGNNRTATVDPDDPTHSSLSGSNSIWWQWTALAEGNYRLQAQSSDFQDNLLASIYQRTQADSSNQLEQVARNFQIASPGPNRSYPAMSNSATFRANANTTYYILIQGYDFGRGNVQLQLSSPPTPNNDAIAEAFPIDSNLAQGNNLAATSEHNEPAHGGAYPGQTLWWTWVAPNNGRVEIEVTDADQSGPEDPAVVFAVYQGPDELSAAPFEDLIPVTSNHDRRDTFSNASSFVAVKNLHYYLAANIRNGIAGDINLSWTFVDGYLLQNPMVTNNRLEFDVVIPPKLAPHFQILVSSDLQTWEAISEVVVASEDKLTIDLDLSAYGPSHFFRVIEAAIP